MTSVLCLSLAYMVGTVASAGAATNHRVFAVLAVSEAAGVAPPAETGRVADVLAKQLQASGHRVILAGVRSSMPAEELSATVNAAGADLVVLLRTVKDHCPAVAVLEAVTPPQQSGSGNDMAELRSAIMQLEAAERHRVSAALVAEITSHQAWCKGHPTELERYVLESTAAPSILVVLPTGVAGNEGVTQVHSAIERTLTHVSK